MRVIEKPIAGKVYVSRNTQFNRIAAEFVEVEKNVHARFYGKVKNLVLNQGSKVYIHGKVVGLVTNNGGELYLYENTPEVENLSGLA
jgi:hypothetical protein